jgi:hypothetical protein
MITSILIVAAVLVLVLSPVLVPAIITAGHAIRRRFFAQSGSAAYLPTVSRRRLVVPAAA